MTMTSVDAQLVEQLGISGKQVCAVYHVPPYKAGVTDPPSYNNIEALDRAYYSQCLQRHIEDAELCLDEGLALTEVQGKTIGVEFDLDDLLRMDSATQIKSEGEAVKSGIKAPNEARRKLNLAPTPGGEGPYLQQQNFSLSALAKRDAQEDPFGTAKPADPPPAANDEEEERRAAAFVGEFRKSLTEALDAA
jgi:phage portal protein BeeE